MHRLIKAGEVGGKYFQESQSVLQICITFMGIRTRTRIQIPLLLFLWWESGFSLWCGSGSSSSSKWCVNLRPLVYRPSAAPFWASAPALEPLQLLYFDSDADPDPAFPSDAYLGPDPDSAFQNDPDPQQWSQLCFIIYHLITWEQIQYNLYLFGTHWYLRLC